MGEALLVALVSGPLGGALVALVGWLRGSRKDNAEADQTVGEAWQAIVAELRSDISDLRQRIDGLEDELRQSRSEEQRLRDEIVRYRRIIQSLLRYMLRLRDSLAQVGEVPDFPRDVEDAMTDPGLP